MTQSSSLHDLVLAEETNYGESSIGLNIICNVEPTTSAIKKHHKLKKINKYERRRQLAAKAAAPVGPGRSSTTTTRTMTTSSSRTSPVVMTSHDNNEMVKKNCPTGIMNDTTPKQQQQDSSSCDDNETGDENNETKDCEMTKPPSTGATMAALPSSSSATVVVRQPSRRYHPQDPFSNPTTRSHYLTSFHLRPSEIDRSHNAPTSLTSTTPFSQPSSHIFSSSLSKDDPFASHNLPPRLVSLLTNPTLEGGLGYETPTIIQSRAWKVLLSNGSNNNLFIQSETGSGKTLAYVVPLVMSLLSIIKSSPPNSTRQSLGTLALLLLPTRELTTQLLATLTPICRCLHTRLLIPGILSGGDKRSSEKSRLRKGLTIVCGTPGRVLDHLTKTDVFKERLKTLEWVVLDEVDRLLDMGLGKQVEAIMKGVKEASKKMMWRSVVASATVGDKVEDLARNVLGGDEWKRVNGDDIDITTTSALTALDMPHDGDNNTNTLLNLSHATPRQLSHQYLIVSAKLRLVTLIAFLTQRIREKQRTLIFFSTCDAVDFHYALLRSMSPLFDDEKEDSNDGSSSNSLWGSQCPRTNIHRLHGNISPTDRSSALQSFASSKNSTPSILLATDVAARGLDVSSIDWIVQYDPPCEMDDYIHRCGRTARAGTSGCAVIFLLPSEKDYVVCLRERGVTGMGERGSMSVEGLLRGVASVCGRVVEEGVRRGGGGVKTEGEAFVKGWEERVESMLSIDEEEELLRQTRKQKRRRRGGTVSKETTISATKEKLIDLARRAFQSWVRAYPTKEKAVRHLFGTRALHLGHVARSFGLREAPRSFVDKNKVRGGGGSSCNNNEMPMNGSGDYSDGMKMKKTNNKTLSFDSELFTKNANDSYGGGGSVNKTMGDVIMRGTKRKIGEYDFE